MELNTIVLRGRVGADIIAHTDVEKGQVFVRFRMVVPRSRKKDDGEWEELEGKWYTVKAWGNLARNINISIRKGQPILVVGRPSSQAWVDKQGEVISEIAVNAISIGHDLGHGATTFLKVTKKNDDTGIHLVTDSSTTSQPAENKSNERSHLDGVDGSSYHDGPTTLSGTDSTNSFNEKSEVEVNDVPF